MEKISKLLFALWGRTKQGRAAWQQTVDSNAFQFSLPNSTVQISEKYDEYHVTIFNGDGMIVDTASSGDLQTATGVDHHHKMMKALYDDARRIALKADATLDDILTQLGVEA